MAALTWQNVNTPQNDLRDLRGITTDMFSGLQGLLDKQKAADNANWDQTKLNNTNALLAGVQEAQTPEEYAAKRAALQQQMAGYGAQVDAVAGRAAMDNRLATLQQRGIADIEYKGKLATETDRPQRDLAMSLYAKGDFAGGDAASEKVVRDKAALYEASRIGQRRVQTEGQTDTAFGLKTAIDNLALTNAPEKFKSEMLTAAAQRNASNASAAASVSHSAAEKLRGELLASQNEDAKATRTSALRNASAQALVKGTMYEGGAYTGKNAKEVSDLIDSTTGNRLDEADKNAMKAYIAKLEAAGGIKVGDTMMPIPLDLLKSQLLGAKDEGWGWSTGGVNYLERSLKEAMNRIEPASKTADGKEIPARSPALDGYHALLAARDSLIENPQLPTGKGGSGSPKPPGEYKSPKPKPHKKD